MSEKKSVKTAAKNTVKKMNPKQIRHEKALVHLAKILDKKPLSVRGIADATECTKRTAAQRLEALKKRGCKFETTSVREGEKGPESKAFGLIKNEASKLLLTSSR